MNGPQFAFFVALAILFIGGLSSLFFAEGGNAEPVAPGKSKKGIFRELPKDAILHKGVWYRRVYGFDSKCCGHPQYGNYYIQLDEVPGGGWKDGQHSAQMFPLEAFDDRKEGKHDCRQHQQARMSYTDKYPNGVMGLDGNYCYVCGKDVEQDWQREARERAEREAAAKQAEWDALPEHRKAARVEYNNLRELAKPQSAKQSPSNNAISFNVQQLGGSCKIG